MRNLNEIVKREGSVSLRALMEKFQASSLRHLIAASEIRLSYESSGGVLSLLGLPVVDGLTSISNNPLTKLDGEGGFVSDFRGGSLHISNVDPSVPIQETTNKAKIFFVGIECRIRQELGDAAQDEVFGSIGVLVPSTKFSETHHFPGEADEFSQMGDGAQIVSVEQLIYDGVPADIILHCVLVEHDSGNIDEYKKKAAELFGKAIQAGLAAIGVPAETAAADEGFIGDISLGLIDVLASFVGADDDPYTSQGLRIPGRDFLADLLIKKGELTGVPAPFKERTLTRDDDPRTLSFNVDPVIVTGVDQGGDRGEYAFYFRAETSTVTTK